MIETKILRAWLKYMGYKNHEIKEILKDFKKVDKDFQKFLRLQRAKKRNEIAITLKLMTLFALSNASYEQLDYTLFYIKVLRLILNDEQTHKT